LEDGALNYKKHSMKKFLIATGVAVLALATVAGAQGYMFSTNLSVGRTGADVVALQTWLIANGFNIPSIASGAAAKGYFGAQTKAAVQRYQASRGIPSTGFVGPLTRAALNGGGGTATVPPAFSCPVGYVCQPTGGTQTGGTTVTPGGITTPGVEGTLSANQSNAGLASTVYEGDTMAAVLGIEIEAKNSDIALQRLKLRMDSSDNSDTKYYNKIYRKLYVTDGSNVLASSDLNSSTVVKDGSNYYITIAGFNYVVPKNSKRTLVVKADLYENIDSTDFDSETYQLGLAANGVRGVDGAGIDQYAGGSSDNGIARTTTIASTLVESATLKLSQNTSSPKKMDVVAASGSSENELDKLTLLTFDLKAEKDAVKVTDINIAVAKAGTGGATASTTVYLYEGSTEIDNASVSLNTAVFSNFDQIIPRDSTRTFTVKADIRNANATVSNFTASATSTGITSENSRGDGVTESGTATGYQHGVRNVGPEITLVSKSISAEGAPQTSGSNNIATSTLTANFVVRVKAVGGDITLGLTQSTTSPFFASTTPAVGSKGYRIYRNGSEDATVGSFATSTSFTVPSTCTVVSGTNTCTLSEGNEVTIPISLVIQGRGLTAPLTSGLYSVGVAAFNWSGNTTNFMDGELDWITPEVSFP
jgi:hypothetical protein